MDELNKLHNAMIEQDMQKSAATVWQAIEELERLRARIAKLEERLQKIVEDTNIAYSSGTLNHSGVNWTLSIQKTALGREE